MLNGPGRACSGPATPLSSEGTDQGTTRDAANTNGGKVLRQA